MPIQCPISFAPLSTEDFRELDYVVMKHAFASQNCLGRLADERIYQSDLAQRLLATGMAVSREVPIYLTHSHFCKQLLLDLIVAEKAVYELKTVKSLTDEHSGQLLTYLHLLDATRGKMINFRSDAVESKFVNAPLTTVERCRFELIADNFAGNSEFIDVVVALLRDWGTGLSLSSYQDAFLVLFGGEEVANAMIPLHRDGFALGNQRFQLASPDVAFRLTAMKGDRSDYRSQLVRLLSYSPLRSIHWVNITYHTVTITTINKP